jgi:CDP-archaeol synthase
LEFTSHLLDPSGLWQAWLFYLPATAVTFATYLVWLAFGQDAVLPLDLGVRLGQRPLIGRGRSFWSPPAAIVVAAFCALIQGRGDDALILGLGAQFGCMLNSFIKRRIGVPRGKPFEPIDNVDFVIGASIFCHFEYGLSPTLFGQGLIVCGLAHYTMGHLIRGYLGRYEPTDGRWPGAEPDF